MTKFAYIFHGGSHPESPEEGEKLIAAWGAWMEGIGSSLLDQGNPFGQSETVGSGGVVSNGGGSNPATGYTLVEAANIEEAIGHAKSCPIIESGGSVEVCEAIVM